MSQVPRPWSLPSKTFAVKGSMVIPAMPTVTAVRFERIGSCTFETIEKRHQIKAPWCGFRDRDVVGPRLEKIGEQGNHACFSVAVRSAGARAADQTREQFGRRQKHRAGFHIFGEAGGSLLERNFNPVGVAARPPSEVSLYIRGIWRPTSRRAPTTSS